jgi:azurin
VRDLAQQQAQPVAAIAVAALARLGDAPAVANDLGRLLMLEGADALAPSRGDLERLWSGPHRGVAQAAAGALLVAMGDGGTWLAAAKSPGRQVAALLAIPTVADPTLRESCATGVERVLTEAGATAEVRAAALAALPALPTDTPESTFATLARALAAGDARAATAAGLLQLPRSCWQAEPANAAANAVLAWAEALSPEARRSPECLVATQCAEELAGMQPPAEGAQMRQRLRQLAVEHYMLRAVREQMRYDRGRLVVAVGKPFTLELHNDDFMAHNLLVVRPGTATAIATAAAAMSPSELDGKGRAYLPKSEDVLAATGLVEPGHSATLSVRAIAEPGHYEYVCTVPGHAVRMRGTLVVTADVDAWWQQNPGLEGLAAPAVHPHGK